MVPGVGTTSRSGSDEEKAARKGHGSVPAQQGPIPSTTAGKAMFQMLGVFAEFERGIIRERESMLLSRALGRWGRNLAGVG